MNGLEQGSQKLLEQQEINVLSREIFTTAIDLLEDEGKPVRNDLFLKHQLFEHTVKSVNPEVYVGITAGTDLKNARKVSIYIQGRGKLELTKRRARGQERFDGKESTKFNRFGHGLDTSWLTHKTADEFLAAIKQVRSEIRPH